MAKREPYPSRNMLTLKEFINDYNNKITISIAAIPFIPFIFVLVQSIAFPGPVYCTDIPCTKSTTPWFDDVTFLIVILIIYAFCVFISCSISAVPGSWMKDATRNKLVMLAVYIILIYSTILLISPAVQRWKVYPYSAVSDYKITVLQDSGHSDSAIVTVTNFSTSYYPDNGYSHVMISVREASGSEAGPQDINPIHNVVYEDATFDDVSKLSGFGTFTRTISGLSSKKSYTVLVIPVTQATNNHPFQGSALVKPNTLSIAGHTESGLLDLRGFARFEWPLS